jgi:diguanylate cyclase (GGDEF)-like protein
VFSVHRLDGVMLIAGQLATSLENALLSQSIERRVAQRVQHLGEDNERLMQLSRTDALTGLANRRGLDVELATLLAVATRRGECIAVAMIDVDHFKQYNDCYGHPAGDDCLVRIAALLRETARGADLVARYGGEEFVLVLKGADAEVALRAAERAREQLAALAVPHERSPYGVVTLSVGVAALVPTGADDGARLLRLADEALYQAKGQGRNRTVGARPDRASGGLVL